jgi:hypothetical protein
MLIPDDLPSRAAPANGQLTRALTNPDQDPAQNPQN